MLICDISKNDVASDILKRRILSFFDLMQEVTAASPRQSSGSNPANGDDNAAILSSLSCELYLERVSTIVNL